MQDYKHVQRWADMLLERPAVRRGRMVNRTSGEPSSQLRERHDASDFETKTQDKIAAAKLSRSAADRHRPAGRMQITIGDTGAELEATPGRRASRPLAGAAASPARKRGNA